MKRTTGTRTDRIIRAITPDLRTSPTGTTGPETTVLRTTGKVAKDDGTRAISVTIDGSPAVLTLNSHDLVKLLGSTPPK